MKKNIIEIKSLHFLYQKEITALKNINLLIHEQESVALIGENGAGKSTLLMQLNGALLPNDGEITINGIPVTKKNLNKIRKNVGIVFQNPNDQLFMPTLFDDVAFGPMNMNLKKDEIKKRTLDALKIVGLESLANRPPYHLSGGEKRRAAIATVLSMNPEILVMDEPSSGLDSKSRRMLINLLNKLNQTKIIATHDLEFALEVCKRVIILKKGEIIADGDIREILKNKKLLKEASIEPPYSLN